MTSALQRVKDKFVYRAVAVSALAVVGAAGLGAGSASAAPSYGGTNDTVAISSKSAINSDLNKTRANITTANYREATKYVYYEHTVDANFTQADYESLQARYSQKDLDNFFRNNNQFFNNYYKVKH